MEDVFSFLSDGVPGWGGVVPLQVEMFRSECGNASIRAQRHALTIKKQTCVCAFRLSNTVVRLFVVRSLSSC